jgi:hypothetical protein
MKRDNPPPPLKRGVIMLDLDLLRRLMRLPEGVAINRVLPDTADSIRLNSVGLVVEGEPLPSRCAVRTGDKVPIITPMFQAALDPTTYRADCVFERWTEEN